MHLQLLKRQHPSSWTWFNRLAVVALIAEAALVALLWCLPASALAAAGDQATADRTDGMTVRTVRASSADGYASTRTYAGAVVAGRASELGFQFSGTVASIAVDIGDTVTAGQRLAALDTAGRQAMLAQAEAGINVAAANLAASQAETKLARQTEQRFANLRQSGHVSAQEYDEQQLSLQARMAQQQLAAASLAQARAARDAAAVDLKDATIRAPYAGIIQARYRDPGSQVNPGQPVLRLVEVQNKEAHVGVPEQLAATLRIGAGHELYWSGQPFPATLTAILPEVDASNRTLTAVYRLDPERGNTLPIGAVVELALTSEVPGAGFWVPLTALTESERGLWGVYVVNDHQILERRLVEIVHSDHQRAYVRGTLKANDRIVTTGIQRLVPGQRVNAGDAAGVG